MEGMPLVRTVASTIPRETACPAHISHDHGAGARYNSRSGRRENHHAAQARSSTDCAL